MPHNIQIHHADCPYCQDIKATAPTLPAPFSLDELAAALNINRNDLHGWRIHHAGRALQAAGYEKTRRLHQGQRSWIWALPVDLLEKKRARFDHFAAELDALALTAIGIERLAQLPLTREARPLSKAIARRWIRRWALGRRWSVWYLPRHPRGRHPITVWAPTEAAAKQWATGGAGQ